MAGAISVAAIRPSPTIPHPSVCESTKTLSLASRGARPRTPGPGLRDRRRAAPDCWPTHRRYMIGRYHYAPAATSNLVLTQRAGALSAK